VLGWFQTIFASSKGWDTWGEKKGLSSGSY
jgi:hypothetical protein